MKLTTKIRYGTRALLELALHHDGGPLSLKEIAERQSVSAKYLEQLFSTLQTAGLLTSIRGARGGYALSKPPDQINLREVYEILEGGDGLVPCTTQPEQCERSLTCVTQEVWKEMYDAGIAVLESTTLEDLAQHARQKQGTAPMYYI